MCVIDGYWFHRITALSAAWFWENFVKYEKYDYGIVTGLCLVAQKNAKGKLSKRS